MSLHFMNRTCADDRGDAFPRRAMGTDACQKEDFAGGRSKLVWGQVLKWMRGRRREGGKEKEKEKENEKEEEERTLSERNAGER